MISDTDTILADAASGSFSGSILQEGQRCTKEIRGCNDGTQSF